MSWRIAGPIAVLVLAACTSSSSSDPSIGQPDATTVPTDLATTPPSAPFETYLVGDNLYIRSGCPAADPMLRGGADGLPKEGQTERARVADLVEEHRLSLLAEFEAVDVRVVPRNGQVWTGPGTATTKLSRPKTSRSRSSSVTTPIVQRSLTPGTASPFYSRCNL